MNTINIQFSKRAYAELLEAAAACAKDDEAPCTPEDFARECVECVLAKRRSLKLAMENNFRAATRPNRAPRVGRADELEAVSA